MDAPQPQMPRRSRLRVAALSLAALAVAAVVAVAAAGAYLARSNADRAHRWQVRAERLQGIDDRLNLLLVRRTAQLNARSAQLSAMAGQVETAQTALSRSEGDVSSLVGRQRELANEKAQLEDQQSALADVAVAYRQCKEGLATAIDHIFQSDLDWVRANADAIDTDCGNADAAFDGYRQAYGGRWRVGALAAVAVLGGCGFRAAEPPATPPAITVPAVSTVSAAVARVGGARTPTLARDSRERLAERLTVRVRNVNCEGLATGSGFAIDPHVLVTNRHVLAGADELQVDTWDGHTLDVSSAGVGTLGDLGVAVVGGTLPEVGEFGPQATQGDVVTAVGYPLGGPLTLADGVVVDRVAGEPFGIGGAVLRLTARVQPGNSGGPLLDSAGQIVGVVFAIEVKTGYGLAIPADTLVDLAQSGGLQDVPACGSH